MSVSPFDNFHIVVENVHKSGARNLPLMPINGHSNAKFLKTNFFCRSWYSRSCWSCSHVWCFRRVSASPLWSTAALLHEIDNVTWIDKQTGLYSDLSFPFSGSTICILMAVYSCGPTPYEKNLVCSSYKSFCFPRPMHCKSITWASQINQSVLLHWYFPSCSTEMTWHTHFSWPIATACIAIFAMLFNFSLQHSMPWKFFSQNDIWPSISEAIHCMFCSVVMTKFQIFPQYPTTAFSIQLSEQHTSPVCRSWSMHGCPSFGE